jgi:BlaI family penicillinase repressor
LSDDLPDLGELEREVMQLVWSQGPITSEQARESLTRPLKESTVRTVLRRLEDKGYVTHTVSGRTYHFVAAEKRGAVAAKAVQRIMDWFCNGSLEEVLVGMMDNQHLEPQQLQALSDKIAASRPGQKITTTSGSFDASCQSRPQNLGPPRAGPQLAGQAAP